MNRILIILIGLLITSCNDGYEKDEFKAIEDFTNDYLAKNHLNHILEPRTFYDDEVVIKPNIDSLDLKVYISDALLPIAQIKEDNEWMFNDNYFGTEDSSIFHELVGSKRFNQLEYKEFDKNKIKIIKPYRQFEKSQEKIETDEEYTLLNFSRVCFDNKRENGIIVIEYRKGFSHGTMSGYNMALLIKKIDDKWTYVPRR